MRRSTETPDDGAPTRTRSFFARGAGHTGKAVGVIVTSLLAAVLGTFAPVYAPRIFNDVVPGRPVTDVTLLGTPPPVDTAQSEPGAQPPVAYNAYAFPAKLTPQEIQELNGIVAGEPRGGTGPGPDALAWMRNHGAYDVGGMVTRVVVQAIDQPVRIASLRAVIKDRQPPLAQTVLYTPPEGSDEVIVAALNLDLASPSAPYFRHWTESMNPGESVVIDVEASVSKFSVVWQLGIDLVVAGSKRTVLVNNEGGQPFRTTGLPSGVAKQSGTLRVVT